jgi:hypothetical protein
VLHHNNNHVVLLGADGHTNPDLARAMRNLIREQAVNAGAGKQQCQHSKKRGELRYQVFDKNLLVDLFGLGCDAVQRQVGITPVHNVANRRNQRFRIRGRTDGKRAIAHPGNVHSRLDFAAKAVIFCVACNAHHHPARPSRFSGIFRQ